MENRIDALFSRLQTEDKKAFVAYVAAGDPDLEHCKAVIKGLADAGADLIELGVPFSDPLADGIVNQMAAQRALDAGATTAKVIELIREVRADGVDAPIVLFTYLNPIYTYGFEAFHKDASAAGADGILSLDLPPDEEGCHKELAYKEGLRHIRLIAPTSPEERIKSISNAAEGFIYYVSREGVTGVQDTVESSIGGQIAAIKKHTDTPVVVGFGISTPEQAKTVAEEADGVVVGSAIVKIVAEEGATPALGQKVRDFVKPLVDAVKSV
jgi:tryptophan synthase alpha chain